MKRTAILLALVAALSIAALTPASAPAAVTAIDNLSPATSETCAPCRRSQCQQLCGPQKPAFCDFDPDSGCPFCACNG